MAICFFTAKSSGTGDLVHAAKLADFVYKLSKKKHYPDPIIIVVPDKEYSKYHPPVDHKAATQFFVTQINSAVQVMTMSEFKAKHYQIDCCIEAGYVLGFDWKTMLGEEAGKIPTIIMPEYCNDVSNFSGKLKIHGGFTKEGVIPNQSILDATQNEILSEDTIRHAFEKLDLKLKAFLGNQIDGVAYFKKRNLSYQYSHDLREYPIHYEEKENRNAKKSYHFYTPARFFLQEHIMFSQNSNKSQDVICIGEDVAKKITAFEDTLE